MRLWAGGVASNLGAHAAGIAYPLLVLAITGSPATVGLVAALRSTPFLLLSLPVGAMVDRWDRRRVMLRCELGCAAAVGSLPLAMWLWQLTITQILVVAVVEGTLSTFYNLAQVATLPKVVARAQLPQATAYNHAGWAAAGVVGPALGTALFQLARAWPFVIEALGFLASAFGLLHLRGDFSAQPRNGPSHLLDDMKTGARWLWAQTLVRHMAMLTGAINLVQAAAPLLLIVTAQQLGATPAQIGLIFSAAGVGGVLGALVGARVTQWLSFGQVIGGTVLLQALLFPLYGWCPSPLWLGLVYGTIMFLAPVYNVVQLSHRLALIPPGLEGRVNATYRFTAHIGIPLGSGLCGLLLERWGTGPTLLSFALLFGALAVVALADPAIRHAPHVVGR